MKIDSDIALILSGGLGLDLSDPFDCNAFALRLGEQWVLFDAGAGCDPARTISVFERLGIRPAHLFLTHAHADHSGATSLLRHEFGLQVWAGSATANLVEAGDESQIGLARARAAGVYPADYAFRPCEIDHRLDDQQTVTINGVAITVLMTPGHSADHVSFVVDLPGRRALVAGDALFHGGHVANSGYIRLQHWEVCNSVRKLASQEDISLFLPGHLAFSLHDGGRHAQAAMTYVEKFQCPPSII